MNFLLDSVSIIYGELRIRNRKKRPGGSFYYEMPNKVLHQNLPPVGREFTQNELVELQRRVVRCRRSLLKRGVQIS